ncbi:MAG TPA: hypothetical protein VFL85_00025 [Candidatus Saccharimonadales bacterium]|nr:hypothetical protein [Candidatus Saccharimonadales bacterium]
MVNHDVRNAWHEYTEEQEAAQQILQEKTALQRALQERIGVARQTALALTDLIGWQPGSNARDKVYDTRYSNPIPLGQLDEAGTKFGFGQVIVYHELEHKEIITPRRWLGNTVTHVYEPTDKLEQLSVVFYAGEENGENAEPFAYNSWHLTDRDNEESVAEIEYCLAVIAEALGYEKPAE